MPSCVGWPRNRWPTVTRTGSGLECEGAVGGVDRDHITVGVLAAEQFERQPIDQLLLDDPFERPRAVHRVEPEIRQRLPCRIGEQQFDILLGRPCLLYTSDAADDLL